MILIGWKVVEPGQVAKFDAKGDEKGKRRGEKRSRRSSFSLVHIVRVTRVSWVEERVKNNSERKAFIPEKYISHSFD